LKNISAGRFPWKLSSDMLLSLKNKGQYQKPWFSRYVLVHCRDVNFGGIIMDPTMKIVTFASVLVVSFLIGCSPTNDEYVTDARLDQGLVIILPGIEGEGTNSYNIRRGLLSAGVRSAIPIYRWGRPIPLAGVLLNQTDFLGNRLAGGRIARFIDCEFLFRAGRNSRCDLLRRKRGRWACAFSRAWRIR
jgi:hypothetical protein